MEKLLLSLATLFNLDATEFTTALKDGDNWLEDDALAEAAMLQIRPKLKSVKDEQHKRALRETEVGQQKWMKAQGFEIPEGMKGDELRTAFLEWKEGQTTTEPGKQPAEMSPEELAKLPAVKSLLAAKLQAAAQETEAVKGEFETYKKNAEQAEVKQLVRQYGTAFLEAEKAILQPEGAKTVTKEARLDDFFSTKIDYSKIGIIEKDGKKIPIPLDESGEQQLDDYGKPVQFTSIIRSKWDPIFGFDEQDRTKGSTSPGQRATTTNGQTQRTKYNFASESDFNTAMKNATDTTERGYMANDYAAQLDKAKT